MHDHTPTGLNRRDRPVKCFFAFARFLRYFAFRLASSFRNAFKVGTLASAITLRARAIQYSPTGRLAYSLRA